MNTEDKSLAVMNAYEAGWDAYERGAPTKCPFAEDTKDARSFWDGFTDAQLAFNMGSL